MKAGKDLAQKTFIFSRKSCSLSVIFIGRLQLKKVEVIVSRKFYLLKNYRLVESYFYYEFIKLYLL